MVLLIASSVVVDVVVAGPCIVVAGDALVAQIHLLAFAGIDKRRQLCYLLPHRVGCQYDSRFEIEFGCLDSLTFELQEDPHHDVNYSQPTSPPKQTSDVKAKNSKFAA